MAGRSANTDPPSCPISRMPLKRTRKSHDIECRSPDTHHYSLLTTVHRFPSESNTLIVRRSQNQNRHRPTKTNSSFSSARRWRLTIIPSIVCRMISGDAYSEQCVLHETYFITREDFVSYKLVEYVFFRNVVA